VLPGLVSSWCLTAATVPRAFILAAVGGSSSGSLKTAANRPLPTSLARDCLLFRKCDRTHLKLRALRYDPIQCLKPGDDFSADQHERDVLPFGPQMRAVEPDHGALLPVLIVLHQETSTPAGSAMCCVRSAIGSISAVPVFGDALPETL